MYMVSKCRPDRRQTHTGLLRSPHAQGVGVDTYHCDAKAQQFRRGPNLPHARIRPHIALPRRISESQVAQHRSATYHARLVLPCMARVSLCHPLHAPPIVCPEVSREGQR